MKLPLLYHDRRLQGDSPCRQAQLVALHLLEVFKFICDAHGIRFWLAYGTLIGALRHKGFIPWDDDLDVWILQSDLNKFIHFAREELPNDVYLELPNDNPRMENGLIRLRDNYSCGFVYHKRHQLLNDHHGITIDIFPLERVGGNTPLCRFFLHQYESTYGIWRRTKYGPVALTSILNKWKCFLWTYLCYVIWRFLESFFIEKPYLIPSSWYLGWKFWYRSEWIIGESKRVALFEGIEMPIPVNPECCLEQEYGKTWNTPPPSDKRVGYYRIVLPTTPCFHPSAMTFPSKGSDYA